MNIEEGDEVNNYVNSFCLLCFLLAFFVLCTSSKTQFIVCEIYVMFDMYRKGEMNYLANSLLAVITDYLPTLMLLRTSRTTQ